MLFRSFLGNLKEYVIRTIWCSRRLSTLELCICRKRNTSYIFGQSLNYFIFELFSSLKCFASFLKSVCSIFSIFWLMLKISCIIKFFIVILPAFKVVILCSSMLQLLLLVWRPVGGLIPSLMEGSRENWSVHFLSLSSFFW